MAKKCGECGGIYEPETADGYQYFHACPPLNLVKVKRGGGELEIPLAELVPTDTVTVHRGGRTLDVLVSAMQPDDIRQGDRTVERANKRDENVDPKRPGPPRAMKAEGRGAVDVKP